MLVYADFDLVFESTTDLDGGCAFLGLEIVFDAVLGKPAQRLEARLARLHSFCRIVLVQQAQPHDRLRRRVEPQQQRAAGLERQSQDVELFSHIDTGHIHIGAPQELERYVGLSRSGYGAYQAYVANDAHRFLNRLGQQVFDFSWCSSGQLGANRDRRVGDVRQQVELQA